MPCRDDGQAEYYAKKEQNDLRERNDRMARILCYISDKLESEYPILSDELLQNQEYAEWLLAHRKADAERRKAEAAREAKEQRRKLLAAKETLAKLTPEQRHELGLP